MPLPISVIIPTYRRPELTAQALLSIYLQTELPREVLILDDGSESEFASLQHRCAQVETRFAGTPLQLRVETLRRHLGTPGAVRNIGMLRASEPWLAFLDSDDVWLPQKLQKQWQRAQQSGARVIHCRELWVRFSPSKKPKKLPEAPHLSSFPDLEWLLPPTAGGHLPQIVSQKKHKHLREGSPQQLWPDALQKCILGPSTVLLHHSAWDEVGYFEPKIQIAEDYEYFLRLIARFVVAYCPEYLVVKRDNIPDKNSGSIPQLSHQHPWIEPFRIAALEKLLLSPRTARLLSSEQQDHAAVELQRKLSICLAGAHKRLAATSNLERIPARTQTQSQIDTQVEIQRLEAKLALWT